MSDFDSPWKETLDLYLQLFLEFFFRNIHDAIDWSRHYESLDTELQQVAPEDEAGRLLADRLYRVWRQDGEEAWVLIHIEVQSQAEPDFAERMLLYQNRLFDRFRRPVASLAILGDDRVSWRPSQYRREIWDCELNFKYPVVKLTDYQDQIPALEAASNPIGLVVLAHLQTNATRQDMETRRAWKSRLIRGLLDSGLDTSTIRQMFRVIDWMMVLPDVLAEELRVEINRYQEEKKMPYITSFERLARKEGLEEGRREAALAKHESIELALTRNFGDGGLELIPAIKSIFDLNRLREIETAIYTKLTVDDIRSLLV